MTPEEIDDIRRKYAARPEWAVAMCADCQGWIRPNLTCTGCRTRMPYPYFHPDGCGIEEAHQDALDGEALAEASKRVSATSWKNLTRHPWDSVLLLFGGIAVTLALIAALGYFLDERHVLGWWMVLAAIFALISSIYALQKTNALARHQWDFVLLLFGGIAVTVALIAALGYYLAERDGRTSRRPQRRSAVVPRAVLADVHETLGDFKGAVR